MKKILVAALFLVSVGLFAQNFQTNPFLYDWTRGAKFSGEMYYPYISENGDTIIMSVLEDGSVIGIPISDIRSGASGKTYYAGNNIVLSGDNNDTINAIGSGSVGNADSLGGVPANQYALKNELPTVSEGYGINVTKAGDDYEVESDTLRVSTIYNVNKTVGTKIDTFAKKDDYEYKQNYYDSRRIQAIYDAQRIRDNAGVPYNVPVGNIAGSVVGMTDSAGATDEAIVIITSEAQAIAESDSGDGSRNNPYLIRDKLIVNSPITGANGGFIWNDPDADYYVKLQNAYLGGYKGRNLYMNSPTKLFVENCHLQALNSGETGYNTAVGIDFDMGTIAIDNTIIGGFGNDFFNIDGGDSLFINNSKFTNDFYTNERNIIYVLSNLYYEMHTSSFGDSLIGNSFLLCDNGASISEIYVSQNDLRFNGLKYMFSIADAASNPATGAFWNNNFHHTAPRGIIYGLQLDNIEIANNTLWGTGQVENPLIFGDGFSKNIRARGNKFTALGDELSEPIFIKRSINGIYEDNWITRSNADGYEFFNSYYGNQILNNVADSIFGQCVDWFTQQGDSANVQYSNKVENIYGDSYDVPVIITNTRGVTVNNVFCSAHNLISAAVEYDTIPAVLIENRAWGENSVPSDIHIMGLMPLPESIPSGKIVKFQSTTGQNNTGYWFDTKDRYYGLTPNAIAKLKVK